ncbi:uncharacterized protein [Onthophagus taurus]|uniref:uncharacterized protein n=1 Tax=Onthophagus taurus TaxID=166361 RepID=UPI0039BEAADE
MTILKRNWVISTILIVLIKTQTIHGKCLNETEILSKNYVHYEGLAMNLTVQTTSRATHKMSSYIFKIFAEEVLNFRQVNIVEIEDNFNASNVIDVLTGKYSTVHIESIPKAMVNLEVWVPPHMDTVTQLASENVLDCGMLGNPGQFSWFIPKNLTGPIANFDPNWPRDFGDVPWTLFKDENFSSTFHIYDKSALLGATQLNMTACYNEETCAYIPEKCLGKTCATLLAPMNHHTEFLKDQINDYDIYVEVIWLGEHFKQATRKVQNSLKNNPNQSVLIMAWTPSDIIYPENDFARVIFNKCKYSAINRYCEAYEPMRLEKFAWTKLQKHAKTAYEAIKNIRFETKAYTEMMKVYNENHDKESFDQMACKWLNLNPDIYKLWHTKSSKHVLYIGGIYPLKDPSYRGFSIANSAKLAVEHIKKLKILNNYDLKFLNMDGECNAEKVMRSFIKYVDGDNTDNIVGVVGPACSDTVEPLAGVSNNFKMLIISYSAEGASFSDREKYPYFFRTIGSNSEFRFVYLELLKKLNWKRVAALTEDGQKYTEYISYTQNLLESNGITFIANSKFPNLRKGLEMRKYLEDLKKKRARIIIADVYDEIARLVMCEAHKLEMTMKHGYIWFLPTWLDPKWYDTDFYNQNHTESVSCSTSTMINAIDGYFSLTPSPWGADDLVTVTNETVRDWKAAYTQKIIDPRTNLTSDYAGYAYDAVWTYALALDKLVAIDADAITELHSNATTHKLVNFIENSDFNGVSGRIHFRGGSTRYSKILLNQWIQNKNFTTVGIFNPNVTNDSPDILGGNLDLNLSKIVWLLGTIPDDGTSPPEMCSLDLLSRAFNVNCEMAIVILCIIIFIIFLIIIGIGMFFYKKKMDSKYLQTQQLMEALGLDQRTVSELDKWETPREHVVINRKLGEGAFGTVYGGEVYIQNTGWVAVAVKTLKRGSTIEEKVDFLSEAETMKKFDHKNIIQLIGVCIKDEPVYTIMEFMLYGDLKTYLLARRNLVNHKNWEDHDDISSKRLTRMAIDVARGLSYLADKKYVHRDIACRNCLVNSNKVVKIGDFGMTRAMYDNDCYKFNRKGMLPVRWMAPESLALGVFTPASDVWSYGVLLYEIITFGSFPFQGLSNNQVLEYVKNGNTLNVPKGVKPQLEIFIKSCWHDDAQKRPTACQTVDFLANNPTLISPSLDGPTAAVAMEGSDEFEVHIPTELRHRPLSTITTTFINNTFTKPPVNHIEPLETPLIDFSERPQRGSAQDSGVSVHFDNYCPREPLLGNLERSTSMNDLMNYVTVNHNHSSPNLYNNPKEIDKEILKHQQQVGQMGNGLLCSN